MENPLHRWRVRNPFQPMRTRLTPSVVKAKTARFIHGGWLVSSYLPVSRSPEAAGLNGLKQMQAGVGIPFVGAALRSRVAARGRR
jgi:hypothetical protein